VTASENAGAERNPVEADDGSTSSFARSARRAYDAEPVSVCDRMYVITNITTRKAAMYTAALVTPLIGSRINA
jgi:hypothetical protein